MHVLLRLAMIFFLATFVGGLFTHTVAASAMAFDMTVVQVGSMAMDDCEGCDDPAMQLGDAACDLACDMAFVATLPEVAQLVHPQSAEPHDIQHEALIGRLPPLGRYPPRTSFMS